jgi:hypothetical protein
MNSQDSSAESTLRGLARLQRLAAEQGVGPVTRFEDLLGDFWPVDESMEEFLATLRAWRQDRVDSSAALPHHYRPTPLRRLGLAPPAS